MVVTTVCICNSAVREASNGIAFMEQAMTYCPMTYRILSGDEEAVYGFKGALQDRLADGLHYATIDIGGGSLIWRSVLKIASIESLFRLVRYVLNPLSDEGPPTSMGRNTVFMGPL